ncbi:MAG: hypothetical protein GY754_11730 [bacterium]|nr:hypothetical protein [bacterium]
MKMKLIKSFFVFMMVLTAALSCSKSPAPGDFSPLLTSMSKAKTYDEIKTYYTSGTITALEKASEKWVLPTNEKRQLLAILDTGTSWRIMKEDIKGDTASVTIEYTGHQVENQVGNQLPVKLVKEKGEWKLDMEEDFKTAIKRGENGSVKEY